MNEVEQFTSFFFVSEFATFWEYLDMQVNKPSVVFIDEIDALATRYVATLSGLSDFRVSCLVYARLPRIF